VTVTLNSAFKQTEFGMVPEGWEVVKLGDLGEVSRGRSRRRPRWAPELYGGPYPFVQTGDVRESRGRIVEYSQTYSETGLAQSRMWPAGTMCITIAANIAETGILKFPACFPDSIVGFIPDETKCNVYFVEYMFRYLRGRIQREAADAGSVQDNINLDTLERLRFPLPDLAIQNAIVAILSPLDNKIQLCWQMKKTLESIAESTFKHWFIEFEFPNEEGDPYKSAGGEMIYDKELGREVPKGWEVKPVDEVANFLNGLALQNSPPESEDEFLPVIKIRELRHGITESSDKASLNIPKEYVVDDGDVLFSWSGSLEAIIWTSGRGALNQHLFKVTSTKVPKWFYYSWLLHHLPEYRRIAEGKATTMGHIQRHHLKSSLVLVPDELTLQRMDKLQHPLIERLILTGMESRKLSQIRDSLLPKLMSGKVQVPVEVR
jgi:type I restriction enzyme S subunit